MSYVNSLEFSRRKNMLLSKSRDEDLFLKELDGFSIYLRESDAAVGRGVKSGAYEPHVTNIFRQYVKPGMHILDIGANIGYFTMLAASLVKSSGSVTAIEPNPENAKLMELSRRANKFDQVTIVQAGAGRALGLLVLNTAYSNGVTSDLSVDPSQLAQRRMGSAPIDGGGSSFRTIRILSKSCAMPPGFMPIPLHMRLFSALTKRARSRRSTAPGRDCR